MTHFEETLQRDADRIRRKVREMASLCGMALEGCLAALGAKKSAARLLGAVSVISASTSSKKRSTGSVSNSSCASSPSRERCASRT